MSKSIATSNSRTLEQKSGWEMALVKVATLRCSRTPSNCCASRLFSPTFKGRDLLTWTQGMSGKASKPEGTTLNLTLEGSTTGATWPQPSSRPGSFLMACFFVEGPGTALKSILGGETSAWSLRIVAGCLVRFYRSEMTF